MQYSIKKIKKLLLQPGPLQLQNTDLSEAPLQGANLTSADLSGANLNKADLNVANLSRADLTRANLNAANLSGADLRKAILFHTDLSEAVLRGADLSDANLGAADLIKADMIKANLRDADLHATNLQFVDLSWADLDGADLSKADLRAANLHNANLINADLHWANLSGAKLVDAKLSGANLNGLIYNMDTKWPKDFDYVAAGIVLGNEKTLSVKFKKPVEQKRLETPRKTRGGAHFQAWINKHLRGHKVKNHELALAIGISESMLSSYFKGIYRPSVEICIRIAAFFQVPINDVLLAAGRHEFASPSYVEKVLQTLSQLEESS